MEQYNLPFLKKSDLKGRIKFLLIFCALCMGAGSIFFFSIMLEDDFYKCLILGVFLLIFSLYFAYTFIAAQILKIFYIEVTKEYLKFSIPFKTTLIYWNEIFSAQIIENKNKIISILLIKDINKIKMRSISKNFNSFLGVPPHSFQIPLMYFKDIDAERLLSTIGKQMEKNEYKSYIENINFNNEECDNNIAKAIIISSFFCILMSVIYGLALYKLEKNYVVIPLLGSLLIISAFNKYYIEENFNIVIRVLVGLICFIQEPLAIAMMLMLSENLVLKDSINVVIEYLTDLIHNPLDQIFIIIIAFVCFIIGAFDGRTKKEKSDA